MNCKCGCGRITALAKKSDGKYRKGQHRMYIHGHNTKGSNNGRWVGGIKLTRGYIMIYDPTHPFNNKNYMPLHRLIMEHFLGRYLTSEEIVHHINEISTDNRIDNLLLTNKVDHKKIFHSDYGKETRFKKGQFLGIKKTKEHIEKMKLGWLKRKKLCGKV